MATAERLLHHPAWGDAWLLNMRFTTVIGRRSIEIQLFAPWHQPDVCVVQDILKKLGLRSLRSEEVGAFLGQHPKALVPGRILVALEPIVAAPKKRWWHRRQRFVWAYTREKTFLLPFASSTNDNFLYLVTPSAQ